MKLMYGPPQMAEYLKNNANIMVVNFNSLKQGFYELNLLPPNTLGAVDEYDFDLKYLSYVFSDDFRFCQIYSIPSAIFNAKDVFIVVDYVLHSDWEYNLVESFLKMIQVRYGFNPCSVNTIEDYSIIKETDFAPYGIANFDEDSTRYVKIAERYNLQNPEYRNYVERQMIKEGYLDGEAVGTQTVGN